MRVLSAHLPPRPESVTQARTLVRSSLGDVVSDGSLEDAQLLVSELVTNGVRHGEIGTGERIELVAEVDPDAHTLLVEVRHPGVGFEPRERAAGETVDSGWGLYILQQLADSWGVSGDGATSVWFTIPTDRPTGA